MIIEIKTLIPPWIMNFNIDERTSNKTGAPKGSNSCYRSLCLRPGVTL